MSVLKISSIENVAGTKYMDATDFVRGTARAYVTWNGVVQNQCNVSSVTFISTGIFDVIFDVPFRTSTYGMFGNSGVNSANTAQATQPYIQFEVSRANKLSTMCRVEFLKESDGLVATPVGFDICFLGD